MYENNTHMHIHICIKETGMRTCAYVQMYEHKHTHMHQRDMHMHMRISSQLFYLRDCMFKAHKFHQGKELTKFLPIHLESSHIQARFLMCACCFLLCHVRLLYTSFIGNSQVFGSYFRISFFVNANRLLRNNFVFSHR